MYEIPVDHNLYHVADSTDMGKLSVGGKEYDVGSGKTIQQAVSEQGLYLDSFLYLIDGKPVPMDTVIGDSAVVKAVKVASGG